MTSSHHGPYALGRKHATMVGTMGCQVARRSEALKAGPSSDRGLQPAPVKSESLVIADHHAAVNMCPSLVHTARQATELGAREVMGPTCLQEGTVPTVNPATGTKS